MPKISVVIPTYNVGKYLIECIDSILNQTYQDFEILVIDDSSTPETVQILHSYKDPRIHLIKGDKKGISAALNLGIIQSKGEYIARMDADDIMYPNRLQIQKDFLDENQNIAMCGSNMVTIDGDFFNQEDYNPIDIRTGLLVGNRILHPTVMFRREAFQSKNLYYNEDLKGCEDLDLWHRVSEIYDIVNIPQYLIKYRLHEDQSSNQFDRDSKILKQIIPAFVKKHTGIEIPNNYQDIIVCSSKHKYTFKQLLEIHQIFIDIYISVANNPRFSPPIIHKYLGIHFQRVILSSLSFFQIVFLFKKLKNTSPELLNKDTWIKILITKSIKNTPLLIIKIIKKIIR